LHDALIEQDNESATEARATMVKDGSQLAA